MATKRYEAIRALNQLAESQLTEESSPVKFEEPVECQCDECKRDREVPMFLRRQAD